ncbi:rCG38565 [Rattus norvegicus]|uniref:RCG38565 n=1 Tax=Rattus norvegicus TaxID=10116 RepID=A6KM22_RAT|nr:rCG38565 [Rattus norvegicus]
MLWSKHAPTTAVCVCVCVCVCVTYNSSKHLMEYGLL